MNIQATNKIVIIGCGNVAWHLAKRLSFLKKYNLFIYNHQKNAALQDFKSELKCKTQANLNNMITDADVYFICVSDNYISQVSQKIKCSTKYGAVVVHTSGSTRLSAIKTTCANQGVFYPLQTFSKKDKVKWSEIPIIIEANNSMAKKRITFLARHFSTKTLYLDYTERCRLHLSAVLVNNFTNALYMAAADLLQQGSTQARFDLLLPLIKQTTRKLERLSPLEAQTGPAKRNDKLVLDNHIKLLSENPDLRRLYRGFSKLIMKQQQAHA